MRQAAAVAFALLATLWTPLAAQRTRDRPTLVFTVSGAYLDGTGLWTVPDQPMDIGGPRPPDHFFLSRSIKRTLGAGFSATYYRGQHFGLTGRGLPARAGLRRRLPDRWAPPSSTSTSQRCQSIDRPGPFGGGGRHRRSAAIYRIGARRVHLAVRARQRAAS